ncbi:MAG: hypothetical protein P8P30_07250 [Rickettsiales bacterium]|nr:hypothetical protein [Rickettsiales bacterium]
MTELNSSNTKTGYLVSPTVDFLTLGGGALLFTLIFSFIPYSEALGVQLAMGTSIATYFINHPNFAHSYQIFYDQFRHKLTREDYPLSLRLRYWWAGVLFPIVAIVFYGICLIGEHYRVIGWAANAMFFTVGWHYVKQGYGVLMVLSVKEKFFFNEKEKKAFLLNSYVVWAVSYLIFNNIMGEVDFLGIKYYTFQTPNIIMTVLSGLVAFTTAYCVGMLVKRYRATGEKPSLIGLIAYISAVYIWLFMRWVDPVLFFVVPAFHSLQYLPFVWRYKYNQYKQNESHRYGYRFRMFIFLSVGFLLGMLGFHLAPFWLAAMISYDETIFGTSLFIFMCWIFINIQHYFMDNAIWRKENQDVQQHLFAN